jgi:competence protein ComEA
MRTFHFFLVFILTIFLPLTPVSAQLSPIDVPILPMHSALHYTVITPLYTLVNKATKQRLDLNETDVASLRDLKGIGPKKAQAIIDYRQQHGRFKTIDELKSVKGIGEKLFKQLRKKFLIGE